MQCVLSGNKYFILLIGKTLYSHTSIIAYLTKERPDLKEVKSVEECDFILAFCPIVSRAGTDIEIALQKLDSVSGNTPTILVVLHYTLDPECVVPDSTRAVKRANTITVDCLFYDEGLLKCRKNNESLATIIAQLNCQVSGNGTIPSPENILNKTTNVDQQGPVVTFPQQSNKNEAEFSGNNFLLVLTGNTLKSHESCIHHLKKEMPDLNQVEEEEKCIFILVFCPIVSRAGTDIEAALQKLDSISVSKPAVLVVLHHTFDPTFPAPDSSRAVQNVCKRENLIAVDCLFYEDQGLLPCPKNDDSLKQVINYIKPLIPRHNSSGSADSDFAQPCQGDENTNSSDGTEQYGKKDKNNKSENSNEILSDKGNLETPSPPQNKKKNLPDKRAHSDEKNKDNENEKSSEENKNKMSKYVEDPQETRFHVFHSFDPECAVPESCSTLKNNDFMFIESAITYTNRVLSWISSFFSGEQQSNEAQKQEESDGDQNEDDVKLKESDINSTLNFSTTQENESREEEQNNSDEPEEEKVEREMESAAKETEEFWDYMKEKYYDPMNCL